MPSCMGVWMMVFTLAFALAYASKKQGYHHSECVFGWVYMMGILFMLALFCIGYVVSCSSGG